MSSFWGIVCQEKNVVLFTWFNHEARYSQAPTFPKKTWRRRLDQEGMEQSLEISEIKKKNQEARELITQIRCTHLESSITSISLCPPPSTNRVNQYRPLFEGASSLQVANIPQLILCQHVSTGTRAATPGGVQAEEGSGHAHAPRTAVRVHMRCGSSGEIRGIVCSSPSILVVFCCIQGTLIVKPCSICSACQCSGLPCCDPRRGLEMMEKAQHGVSSSDRLLLLLRFPLFQIFLLFPLLLLLFLSTI